MGEANLYSVRSIGGCSANEAVQERRERDDEETTAEIGNGCERITVVVHELGGSTTASIRIRIAGRVAAAALVGSRALLVPFLLLVLVLLVLLVLAISVLVLLRRVVLQLERETRGQLRRRSKTRQNSREEEDGQQKVRAMDTD